MSGQDNPKYEFGSKMLIRKENDEVIAVTNFDEKFTFDNIRDIKNENPSDFYIALICEDWDGIVEEECLLCPAVFRGIVWPDLFHTMKTHYDNYHPNNPGLMQQTTSQLHPNH